MKLLRKTYRILFTFLIGIPVFIIGLIFSPFGSKFALHLMKITNNYIEKLKQ